MNTITIHSIMLKAVAKGIKRPHIRLGEFMFTLAPANGKNPNCVYITDIKGDYIGKIAPNDAISWMSFVTAEAHTAVHIILEDIPAAATAYGRRTGNCCICNRLLTAKESINNCIGPICASKYGLMFSTDEGEDF